MINSRKTLDEAQRFAWILTITERDLQGVAGRVSAYADDLPFLGTRATLGHTSSPDGHNLGRIEALQDVDIHKPLKI